MKKKEIKESLKKLIEGKTIQQIESEIEGHIKNEKEEDKQKIQKLYALQTTRRYQENPFFKKSPFETYLYVRWWIRPNTFDYLCKAYFNFPDFSMKYSPILIEKIISQCTPLKAPDVIREINNLEKKRKRLLTRDDIENVIAKYRKPKKASVIPLPDWREKAERLEKEVRYWKTEAKKWKALYEKIKRTLKEKPELFQSSTEEDNDGQKSGEKIHQAG